MAAGAAFLRPKAFRRSSTVMSCARSLVCFGQTDPSGSLSKRAIVAASAASSAGRSTSSDNSFGQFLARIAGGCAFIKEGVTDVCRRGRMTWRIAYGA